MLWYCRWIICIELDRGRDMTSKCFQAASKYGRGHGAWEGQLMRLVSTRCFLAHLLDYCTSVHSLICTFLGYELFGNVWLLFDNIWETKNKEDIHVDIFDSSLPHSSWVETAVVLIALHVVALLWNSTVQKSRSCVGWRLWQNLSESSIIAGETAQLWWHSCLGSDISMPAVAPTSAAGLVMTGSSVALWNTTPSVALSAADKLRDTKHRVRRARSDILSGNEFEIEVDFSCCSTYPGETGMARGKKLKCKLIIRLIFFFYRFLKGIFTLLMLLMWRNIELVEIDGPIWWLMIQWEFDRKSYGLTLWAS